MTKDFLRNSASICARFFMPIAIGMGACAAINHSLDLHGWMQNLSVTAFGVGSLVWGARNLRKLFQEQADLEDAHLEQEATSSHDVPRKLGELHL